jgi:hypothetical protein
LRRVRVIDIYGERIEFTFRGNRKYQTNFGAAMTLLLGVTLLAYMLSQFGDVWANKIRSISEVTKWVDLSKADEFNPAVHGFDFGFGFVDDKPLLPSFGTWEVSQWDYRREKDDTDPTGSKIKQKTRK